MALGLKRSSTRFGQPEVPPGLPTSRGARIPHPGAEVPVCHQPLERDVHRAGRYLVARLQLDFVSDRQALGIFPQALNGQENQVFELARVSYFRHAFIM